MREAKEIQIVFDTFEDLMGGVKRNKRYLKDYWGEKYKDNKYHLTIDPTEELIDIGNSMGGY